jgi:hypothetical protein
MRAPREGWVRAWPVWPRAPIVFRVRCEACSHRVAWTTRSGAAEDAAWHRAENLTHSLSVRRQRLYRDDVIEGVQSAVEMLLTCAVLGSLLFGALALVDRYGLQLIADLVERLGAKTP